VQGLPSLGGCANGSESEGEELELHLVVRIVDVYVLDEQEIGGQMRERV
jgi:hypothetical protein